jgi:hypothetical protein
MREKDICNQTKAEEVPQEQICLIANGKRSFSS